MATTLRKCRFLARGSGTDDFAVGAAIPGFVLPAAAHAEDLTYNYIAFFGNEFESGDGAYSVADLTLTRDVVLSSSNNDQLVNFSGVPTVIMTYATEQPAQFGRLIKSTFFTSSTTWVKDPRTKSILAFVTGGGAGSGAANGNASGAGGAGAGATAISFIDVSLVTSWPVTVGAAGAVAGNGGTSSLNTTTVVASGGIASANTALDSTTPGAVGGTTGTGNIVIPGGSGGSGIGGSSGGIGGASFWGGGGVGAAGQAYGSGAGGAGPNGSGAVGKVGIIWILEFT